MELKISKKIEETKEITLPYFCKNNCFAYKIISDKQCVQVLYSLENEPVIGVYHAEHPFTSDQVDITESEFMGYYNKVSAALTLKIQSI